MKGVDRGGIDERMLVNGVHPVNCVVGDDTRLEEREERRSKGTGPFTLS